MARNLSLLAHLPLLEADGLTHRRDCECVRCDAGFRPSEQERAEARRRFDARRAHELSARAAARRRERLEAKRAEIDAFVDDQVRAADAQVRALREAGARAREDRRLAELQRLRRAGLSLREALEKIESE
jgi:hypothetical protein